MKIIRNEKLIERNKKITGYISLGGLILFLGYSYYTFRIYNEQAAFTLQNAIILIGLFVVFFILVQVSSYLGPRFGGSPRIDEKIDASLKGLHSEFCLYHYIAPTSHLLIGPSGLWVLLPYFQQGKIEYINNRWKLGGGNIIQKYLRLLGFERLGNPGKDTQAEIGLVKRFLIKNSPDQGFPEVRAVLIFTDEKVELNASDSPIPAMKLKQLKDFMRQESKNRALTNEEINNLTKLFSTE